MGRIEADNALESLVFEFRPCSRFGRLPLVTCVTYVPFKQGNNCMQIEILPTELQI